MFFSSSSHSDLREIKKDFLYAFMQSSNQLDLGQLLSLSLSLTKSFVLIRAFFPPKIKKRNKKRNGGFASWFCRSKRIGCCRKFSSLFFSSSSSSTLNCRLFFLSLSEKVLQDASFSQRFTMLLDHCSTEVLFFERELQCLKIVKKNLSQETFRGLQK